MAEILRCQLRFCIGGLCALFMAFSCAVSRASDAELQNYFEQLRGRGLFTVAEGYCLDRLSRGELSDQRRSQLVLEFSHTLAEHANFVEPSEQAELWRRAADVIAEHLQKFPNDSQRLALESQSAAVAASRAETLSWQARLNHHDTELASAAHEAYSTAISQNVAAEATIAEAFSAAVKRRDDSSEFRLSDIRSLHNDVRYLLAKTYLGLAELETGNAPERQEHIRLSEEIAEKLAAGFPGEPPTMEARVLLARASRLRGEADKTLQAVTTIEKAQPSWPIRDAAMVERVRLLLDEQRAADAAETLLKYRQERRGLSGELHVLNLQSLIALAEIANQKKDTALADSLQQQIETHTALAEREIGGYWAYRCRLLRESSRASHEYGSELAAIIQKAQSLYGRNEKADAAKEFANAGRVAFRNKKTDLAIEMAYTRGSILLDDQQYEAAAAAFREIADQFPDNSRAPNSHLLYAYSVGQLYDEERSDARLKAYIAALGNHRAKFPNDPSLAEATWMLAQVQEQQGLTSKALSLYLEIPANHSRAAEAAVAIARCYEVMLHTQRSEKNPDLTVWESEAIERLGKIAAAFPADAGQLDDGQIDVLLRLARIQLARRPPQYVEADRQLERVFQELSVEGERKSSDSLRSVQSEATRLRVVSLAGQGRFAQAKGLIQNLSDYKVDEALDVLDGLAAMADPTRETASRDLAELQLRAAEGLRAREGDLTPPQRLRLERSLAQAYSTLNLSQKALNTYEALLAQSPNDRTLLKEVSRLLVDCGSRECLEKAKTNWRKVESLEKPGSPDWFEARYQSTRVLLLLHEYEECRKLLNVTRLLHPELGGETLQKKFQALEAELTSPRIQK